MKYILWMALMILSAQLYAQRLKPKAAARFNTTNVKDSIRLQGHGMVYLYEDRSDKIRFLGQLCLVKAELASGDIFKWGFGGSADVFFNKFLSLNADYTYDYIDVNKIMSRNDNQTNNSLNDVRGFSSLEGGVRIFLKDQKVKAYHRIILESRHSGRTTIEYYIKPKLPCRKILALRAGYIGYNNIVTTDMTSSKSIVAKDGTVLGNTYFTNSFNHGAYLGIGKLTMFSAVTKNNIKKGNVYLSKAVNELYADLIFATTTFDPIVDSNGAHKIIANDPGSFKTIPVGARVGYRKSKENRGIGTFKVELGYRPGVVGTGFYFNMGFSLALIK